METQFFGPYLIGAFLGGCLAGLLPLFLGKYYGSGRLGDIGFLCCVAASMLLGAILSVPVAMIFSIIIFVRRKHENT